MGEVALLDVGPFGKWDQSAVRQMLPDMKPWDGEDAAVVLFPGGEHDADHLNATLAPLRRCVLLLVSDEGSTLRLADVDLSSVEHLWVMTPDPRRDYPTGTRFLPEGPNPALAPLFATMDPPVKSTPVGWAGQVNHQRRRDLVSLMEAHTGRRHRWECYASPGFTKGLRPPDYAALLARSMVVPCPSGPATVDSMRVWEALDAGCVVALDAVCPAYDEGEAYWQMVLGDHPLPLVRGWAELPGIAEDVAARWPQVAVEVGAWWLAWKDRLARTLAADIASL